MIKSFLRLGFLLVCAVISVISCNKNEMGNSIDNRPVEFFATMAEVESYVDTGTRTTTKDGRTVVWSEGDRVSIFRSENVNDEYIVKDGFWGKTTTKLVKVEDGSFNAGVENPFDANIAYYPFGNVAYSGSDGNHSLNVLLPSEQNYAANSFGAGALPMVAVSESKSDNNLTFRNLLGMIKIQLTSPRFHYTVKDITIKGNNNEPLSGEVAVKCSNTDVPSISFVDGEANDHVTLNCAEKAELIPEKLTEFWIALPPVTFENGITVTVNFGNGEKLEKKSTAALTIERSMVTPMSVLEVDTEMGELYIPDKAFKAYLLDNVDMDGDGLITPKDAEAWNEKEGDKVFTLSWKNSVVSLKGIEYFTALRVLNCDNNKIVELDLSKNIALEELFCYYNSITRLDLSKNVKLKVLNASYNSLESFTFGDNSSLEELYCRNNNLSELDISGISSLKALDCSNNSLEQLNLGNNEKLEQLYCNNNSIANVALGNNPVLTKFDCSGNRLSSLVIDKNEALEYLNCENNQLRSLDLTKNRALKTLSCNGNLLTTLDVSSTSLDSGEGHPLSCYMESLKTLYLKTGWSIDGINVDRNDYFIHPDTVIEYKD